MKVIVGRILLIIFIAATGSCQSQTTTQDKKTGSQTQTKDAAIAEYVVEILEDSKGNLWLGTINKGAAR